MHAPRGETGHAAVAQSDSDLTRVQCRSMVQSTVVDQPAVATRDVSATVLWPAELRRADQFQWLAWLGDVQIKVSYVSRLAETALTLACELLPAAPD
jgi:hypothetical protein